MFQLTLLRLKGTSYHKIKEYPTVKVAVKGDKISIDGVSVRNIFKCFLDCVGFMKGCFAP